MGRVSSTGLTWILLLLASGCLCQGQYAVQHISMYTRHGTRTTYFNVLNESFTLSEGVGNLTANGMRLMYLLGSQVAKNYPGIFPANELAFKSQNYEIWSSGSVRNIESANAFLLGAFPLGTGNLTNGQPTNSTYMNPPFDWVNQANLANTSVLPRQYRPFSYRVSTTAIDFNFFPTAYEICPNANNTAKSEMIKLWDKYNVNMSALSTQLIAAGYSPSLYNASTWDINSMDLLHDEMIAYYSHEGQYAPGMTKQLYDQLTLVSNINIAILYPTNKLTRLNADGIAREIINGIDAYINGSRPLTFRYFSGHDIGLFSHLLLYGRSSLQCWVDAFNLNKPPVQPCEGSPDFGSSFIYELNKNGQGAYYVRLLWNGLPFNVCGSQSTDQFYCEWSIFKNYVQQNLFYNDGDFTQFCGNQLMLNYQKNTETHKGMKATLIILGVVFCLLLFSIIGLFFLTRKLEHKLSSSGNGYDQVSSTQG